MKMFVNVSAYEDRQKAKRESIISRPLFSSNDKSLSTTTAAASSSSSSSSSFTKSAAVQQQKLASLSRVRQISTSGRRRNLFGANSASSLSKLQNSTKSILGVRRKSSSDQAQGLEPTDSKRRQLSDTPAFDQPLNCSSAHREFHTPSTEPSTKDVGVSGSEHLEAEKCETHQTADALSLVSNYNSSASSSNDSD